MLRKISLLLAFIVLMINVRLSGEYFGFEQGYQYAVDTYTEIRFSHGTVYFYLFEQYAQLVLGMIFFLIGKTVKKESLSQIICAPSLLWVIYKYYYIYIPKSRYFNDVEPFSKLLRESMPLDVICFSIVSMLLIYQLGIVLKLLYSKHQTVSDGRTELE